MTTRRTLDAIATRDGRWWLVTIPELDTVGQARTLNEVQAVAEEVAALYLDVPEETLELRVSVEISEKARELWHEAEKAEEEARRAQQLSAALRRQAVATARADHYTLDATAAAFGVSRTRIQQLEKATPAQLDTAELATSA